MRIGLIGNMNNNNFAIMRYFRDLGADAHLLLYKNDGQASLSHFKPEADTWTIEKWTPYIHQTNIPNALVAALDFPLSWLVSYRSLLRTKLRLQEYWVPNVSRRQIRCAYGDYDFLIGSGITPATLMRLNRKLDIFYPYSCRVEFLYADSFVRMFSYANMFSAKILNRIQKRQADGIRQATKTFNCEPGITNDALANIGVTPVNIAIPMVYARESLPDSPPNKALANVLELISASSISILHHARLMWKNNGTLSDEDWRLESKNTDWLIRAFAGLIAKRANTKPCLFIVEYGTDVIATRELISQLGITKYVRWLPKMQRRELMWLLSRVSVGVGEFYDVPRMIWGGTGWEVLASGKPLLQGFRFEQGEFDAIFGYPPPPILPVRCESDILEHLCDLTDLPEKCEVIGRSAKEWFDMYNGMELAGQWLKLLTASSVEFGSPDFRR